MFSYEHLNIIFVSATPQNHLLNFKEPVRLYKPCDYVRSYTGLYFSQNYDEYHDLVLSLKEISKDLAAREMKVVKCVRDDASSKIIFLFSASFCVGHLPRPPGSACLKT